MQFIIGKKIGMTSFFGEAGVEYPVTILEVGPCSVVQVKTMENDGYSAVQIGFVEKKENRTNRPLKGHFEKANLAPKQFLKEFRVEAAAQVEVGSVIDASIFNQGDSITVTGFSKGKGFQGVVKRHNFRLQGQSHGTHESKRGPGSIGQCTWPSKVIKGKKMAGRMGNEKITIKNLEILKIDAEKNLIMVKGSVPGGRNSVLKIRKQEA